METSSLSSQELHSNSGLKTQEMHSNSGLKTQEMHSNSGLKTQEIHSNSGLKTQEIHSNSGRNADQNRSKSPDGRLSDSQLTADHQVGSDLSDQKDEISDSRSDQVSYDDTQPKTVTEGRGSMSNISASRPVDQRSTPTGNSLGLRARPDLPDEPTESGHSSQRNSVERDLLPADSVRSKTAPNSDVLNSVDNLNSSNERKDDTIDDSESTISDHGDQTTEQQSNKMWKPTVLVLPPGGQKGFLELGSLSYFEEVNFIDDVHTVIGCSVGSIIGLLLVVGYTVLEIISEAADTDLFHDISSLNLKEIRDNIGLLNNTHVRKKLEVLLRRKFGMVPTLRQLHMATGIRFCVVSFNLSRGEPAYLTAETEPDLSCVDAVMLSSNIPFLFYRLKYKGATYIDGAFGNPYPIDVYDNGENNVLGMYICSNDEHTPEDDGNWWYLNMVVHCSMHEIRRLIIDKSSDRCKHMPLNAPQSDFPGIVYKAADKGRMISIGYQTAKEFYSRIRAENGLPVDITDSEGNPSPGQLIAEQLGDSHPLSETGALRMLQDGDDIYYQDVDVDETIDDPMPRTSSDTQPSGLDADRGTDTRSDDEEEKSGNSIFVEVTPQMKQRLADIDLFDQHANFAVKTRTFAHHGSDSYDSTDELGSTDDDRDGFQDRSVHGHPLPSFLPRLSREEVGNGNYPKNHPTTEQSDKSVESRSRSTERGYSASQQDVQNSRGGQSSWRNRSAWANEDEDGPLVQKPSDIFPENYLRRLDDRLHRLQTETEEHDRFSDRPQEDRDHDRSSRSASQLRENPRGRSAQSDESDGEYSTTARSWVSNPEARKDSWDRFSRDEPVHPNRRPSRYRRHEKTQEPQQGSGHNAQELPMRPKTNRDRYQREDVRPYPEDDQGYYDRDQDPRRAEYRSPHNYDRDSRAPTRLGVDDPRNRPQESPSNPGRRVRVGDPRAPTGVRAQYPRRRDPRSHPRRPDRGRYQPDDSRFNRR